MNTLEKYLFEKYKEDLKEVFPHLQRAHEVLARSNSPKLSGIRQEILNGQSTGSIAGLTPLPDALYLYLLVREYKPQRIFEIGTWVGTSALFMAEALKKNGGGHIYTCDANQYYVFSEDYADLVTYIPGHSDKVLERFKEDGTLFDFVFIDGNITTRTRELFAQTTHKKTVFALHDFLLPDDKGIQAFLLLPHKKAYAFLPPQPYKTKASDATINKMTAVFLPTDITTNKLQKKNGVSLFVYRFFLLFSYTIGRTWRKIQSFFK